MDELLRKLNYKNQKNLIIINPPTEFEPQLSEISKQANVVQSTYSIDIEFILVFVRSKTEVKDFAGLVAPKLIGDCVVWIAYPKKSSKKYTCDINRDDGWQPMGDLGYEGVRMISIDADWSALRLRNADYIKVMHRERLGAMSQQGQLKANSGKR